MEYQNTVYEFKALTKARLIWGMICWAIFFLVIFLIMDKYVFYNDTGADIFSIAKTFGIPMIISFGFLKILLNYKLSKTYQITILDNKIQILAKDEVVNIIDLKNLQFFMFKVSLKPRATTYQFKVFNKTILLFNGLFFTEEKEVIRSEEFFNNTLFQYFDNRKDYKKDIINNRGTISYTFTKIL